MAECTLKSNFKARLNEFVSSLCVMDHVTDKVMFKCLRYKLPAICRVANDDFIAARKALSWSMSRDFVVMATRLEAAGARCHGNHSLQ